MMLLRRVALLPSASKPDPCPTSAFTAAPACVIARTG